MIQGSISCNFFAKISKYTIVFWSGINSISTFYLPKGIYMWKTKCIGSPHIEEKKCDGTIGKSQFYNGAPEKMTICKTPQLQNNPHLKYTFLH